MSPLLRAGGRLATFALLGVLAGCGTAEGVMGDPGAPGAVGPVGPAGPAGPVPMSIGEFAARFGPPNPAVAGTGTPCTLGEVTLTAATVGRGVPAAGQLLPISQHTALFSLLGTTYGGDGKSNFALPDLRGLAPLYMTYMICTEGTFPSKI